MGLFKKISDKFTKKETYEDNNTVFFVHLLMKEKCPMPAEEFMTSVMEKHVGEVDCMYDAKNAIFAAKRYEAIFKDGSMPPQLMVAEPTEIKDLNIDHMTRIQMWDCPESEKILEECKYHVVAADFLGSAMNYKDRADMIMDFVEALIEMFPQCEAVYFRNSGKMFTRDAVANHQVDRKTRFVYFAVNARFFRIRDTEEMIVDTLGMGIAGLPDVQYHFKNFDPGQVINHAYNTASFIFDNDCPIKSGDVIDGIKDGHISQEVMWKCQFEESIIEPKRPLLDICMGEYAGGGRA